ncbi:class I SAM-dependent methyltransferase [Actinoplanes sp. NPDC023714]|uniref:class I SAM-dependent methyltransferase n=1 Tax=Actinoplanes sp. NPDC023714 TaxID=3154322 RepID=UPI0033D0B992
MNSPSSPSSPSSPDRAVVASPPERPAASHPERPAASDLERLASAHLRAGDPTGWFEPLYASSPAVPWDVPEASAHLRAHPLPPGEGRRALVVGCGPGRDAEHIAALGYATTAFDISPTAIDLARSRHPSSAVTYVVADLLNPPAGWRHAFDLVLESNNVQALPSAPLSPSSPPSPTSPYAPSTPSPRSSLSSPSSPSSIRAAAITAVGEFVAPGGTLLVLAAAAVAGGDGPPWPLTRDEMTAFAVGGLRMVSLEQTAAPGSRLHSRWKAVLTR